MKKSSEHVYLENATEFTEHICAIMSKYRIQISVRYIITVVERENMTGNTKARI